MAGSILAQQGTIQTVGSTGATLSTGTAVSLGTVDGRTSGNVANLFSALFSLTAQWATVTGIAAGTTIADLYLVPAIDDTNYPDIDTTSGASYIPFTMRAGSFVAAKVPTASTNALFQSAAVDLQPVLYTAYIINRSGQTMASGTALKVRGSAAQYT
jgi:hypothetical protein